MARKRGQHSPDILTFREDKSPQTERERADNFSKKLSALSISVWRLSSLKSSTLSHSAVAHWQFLMRESR